VTTVAGERGSEIGEKQAAPRFSYEDMCRANEEWGANCGPGAIAAICGLTLDELRPHLGDFEEKGYTNPTLMFEILERIGAQIRVRSIAANLKTPLTWPDYGLVRIQWEGPWCAPGVPMAARYRHTHWIGANGRNPRNIGIWDVNCMNNGTGWVSLENWRAIAVPHILRACVPRADGGWHLTHAIEVRGMVNKQIARMR